MGAYPIYIDIFIVLGLSLLLISLTCLLICLSRAWNAIMRSRIQRAINARRLHNDDFRLKNGYSWDYCIVFRVFEDDEIATFDQQKYSMKMILSRLSEGGLEIRLFYDLLRKRVFCKIRAPRSRLLDEADKIKYPLATDPLELEVLAKMGRKGLWDPLEIPEKSVETNIGPYEHIYLHYQCAIDDQRWKDQMQKIFKKWPQYNVTTSASTTSQSVIERRDEGIFRGVDRIKLITLIISSTTEGGCALDIPKLIRDDCLCGAFPLHDSVELRVLESNWLKILQWPWTLDTDAIKNYFGEKLGFYFTWLGFYTSWLFVAAVVSVFAWLYVAVQNDPNAPDIPYFAGFMALWGTLFLEYWKRNEKYTALRWGMCGYEATEQVRPSFFGEKKPSPVTGSLELHFSVYQRGWRNFKSYSNICGAIGVVIGAIAMIFFIRAIMSKVNGFVGLVVTSILFAIEILVMNRYYEGFARRLTDNENHRTDTEYEDSLIVKSFTFQFINSFTPFFYIAFLKPFIPQIDPCYQSCMYELQVSVGTIFITRLVVANLTEIISPLITLRSKKRSILSVYESSLTSKGIQENYSMTEVEMAFLLPEYDPMLATFSEYDEMVIQFGYTTMFVAAFPLGTLMSFVCNFVELRIDAWKLCQLYRRPEPRSCEDIGSWYIVLEFVSYASVLTNAGIVAYTGTYSTEFTWSERAWIFVLMSAGLIGIKELIVYCIEDVPPEVEIQLARQDYIRDKLEYNIADSHAAHMVSRCVPKYIILGYDDDPL